MAAGNGQLDDEGNLKRLHQAMNALAEEWQRQPAILEAREGEFRAQPAEIKGAFRKFYKRLPASKWDLLSGNYELQPITHFLKGDRLSVVKWIGIGVGIGAAVLVIVLAVILLISK